MNWISDPEDLARARATFDLYAFAERAMRQNLRGRFPGESDEEIERRLVSWLRKDPWERWNRLKPLTAADLRMA